jgi:hypothetical protein
VNGTGGFDLPTLGYKTFYFKQMRTIKMLSGICDMSNEIEMLECGKEGNVIEAFEDMPEMSGHTRIDLTSEDRK